MEPISFLLDTFIQLAERIINLEKTKRDDKQQVFKEIINPLFIQLQPVAENYLNIFSKAKEDIIEKPNRDLVRKKLFKGKQQDDIKKANHNFARIFDEIKSLRKEMLLARSTVKAMAEQIRQLYKDEIITEFAERIILFFDASVFDDSRNRISIWDDETYSARLVQLFEEVMTGHAEEYELKEFIVKAHDSLEWKWAKIVKTYSAAKIYCLSAPNLIKQRK